MIPLFLAAAVCYLISALGVTAGAHRLWSHKSYKASLPLRVFLALANSMAFQVTQTKRVNIIDAYTHYDITADTFATTADLQLSCFRVL